MRRRPRPSAQPAMITYHVVRQEIIGRPLGFALTALLFLAAVFTLQWLLNPDDLLYIVLGDHSLSPGERLRTLGEGVLNVFRYADDPLPISLLAIAALLSPAAALQILHKAPGGRRPLALAALTAAAGALLAPLAGGPQAAPARLTLALAVILSAWALGAIAERTARRIT